MLLKDDSKKKGMIVHIMRKMKGGDSYEEMKEKNMDAALDADDRGMKEDRQPGLEAAADEMIQAFESKDKEMLISAMKAFIEMVD